MADDQSKMDGRRKDGQPFKPGNTREDGSYEVGKHRPPKAGRFAANDGRKRGARAKGTKNLLTEWQEELHSKMTLTENGAKKSITKRRAMIKATIDRGIRKSDRAAETALRYAELSEKRDPGLQRDDNEIIKAWLRSEKRGDSDDVNDRAADSGDGDEVCGDG